MRSVFVAALLCLALPAAAQQAGTVSFGAPTTGGAPSGCRLFRDTTALGTVTSGQSVPNLFPAASGTWTFGVECFNASGAGPRVDTRVTLGPPLPGAPVQIVITAPCLSAVPPTCAITVTP
jgi:hypothetical protein